MRTIVMTGASRGIGRAALRRLAAQAPTHLVLLGRSTPTGLVDEARSAGAEVSLVHADLSSMSSVDAAAAEVTDLVETGRLPPIEAAVLNAGVQHTNALTETVDGLESTFAVNVLANHVLLTRLRSQLSLAARIVVTVSDTHFGDLRHNLGMVPGPKWQPVERSRASARSPTPRAHQRAAPPIPPVSLRPSISSTSTPGASPPGRRSSLTTLGSSPEQVWLATRMPSPGSRCVGSCHCWLSRLWRQHPPGQGDCSPTQRWVPLKRRTAPTSTATALPGHRRSPTTRHANDAHGKRSRR